ncbi:cytochrome b/b6 domain-containing protein [Frigidibacter sp. RF13]|uniref:cytochrome b/b6 domain-containing protein n=1 Tax=Frigidibacter sp. RF13 TaxID=2997340 RepID=UPI00226FC6F2|nr:cytochrome b/b6 domain-containing protein [Frigidibacter sp. RF13]MCY1127169.1 cytochrome b/b6 domain-containing protein [Frigidibacter sp. RF13]
MSLSNTVRSYGSAARLLHWTVALLILVNIPLALWAEGLPRTSDADAALLARVYSAHKTIGVIVFALALVRVFWALTQPKPAPIHPARRLETFAAEAVHWSLYAAILILPLSGWIGHAASTGFAPILWPFGQSLPFVPKSENLAHLAGAVHGVASKLLILSILLHVAGAVKHVLIDRDGTLARMITGRAAGDGRTEPSHRPALLSLALWGALIAAVLTFAPPSRNEGAATVATAEGGNWSVADSTITFTVRQMGQEVTGSFAGWTARISYDEGSRTGDTDVTIPLEGMTLGAVTEQAAGPEFFDRATFPEARFKATIADEAGSLTARGTLSLRGKELPVALPFTLTIDGDTATAAGTVTLDRRDFGMGPSYPDESTVGFAVRVDIALTAQRGD